MYKSVFTKTSYKDFKKLTPKEKLKLKEILTNKVLIEPFSGKRLAGDLRGFFSIRLSYKDRIIYSIDSDKNIIYFHRVRTHYGD